MTNSPSASGADLARKALADYKASTWALPSRTSRPAKKRRARGDRRDPVPLGAALQDVSADPTWDSALRGGGIRDQWATIAPELVGKVDAEGFDPATRVLALRPMSPAYAAQLRLLGAQLVARINTTAGAGAVRAIRVLPPGSTADRRSEASVAEPPTARPTAEREPRTRAEASAGYHQALTALENSRPTTSPADDPATRDRWFANTRGTLREPQPAEATPLPQRVSDSDDARQRALQRLRAEKTGRPIPGVRRLGETA